MARAPVGAKLVASTHMPWPTIVMRNVWVLPGVPQIFAMKMAVVRQELRGGLAVLSIALHTQLDEGNLKPHLDAVVAAHPDVAIGSYPKWRDDRYRTKVTFDGSDRARLDTARDALRAALPEDTIVDVDA
jgi:molybdopterin-biosynthesis enzyme MoeA-like protein